MKLKNISKNIKKLLEYKSVDYKRKYFILSNFFDTDILDSKKLNEEFNCYLNSLNYSNGKYPEENDLINFYKECQQYSNNSKKLIESKIKFIKKYNDLSNPKNKKDIESLINESLDKVGFSNKSIDKKLGLTLKESIKLKKSILVESEYASRIEDEEEDIDKDLLDKEDKSEEEDPTALELQSIDTQDIDLSDTEVKDQDESAEDKLLRKKESKVLKEYDWLLKKENIPFIRNRLNFYLPVGSDASFIGPNLEKIPVVDKLSIISLYKLIVEQNASNAAMRKWNIIHKIRYYLNIQQKLMYAEIIKMGEANLKGTYGRYTSGTSNLGSDQKREIKIELDKIISKINKSNASSLDSNTISELKLTRLLRRAAGNQLKDVDNFIQYLEAIYPDSKSNVEQDILSDEEYQEYIKANKEFDEKLELQDKEILDNLEPEEDLESKEDLEIDKIEIEKPEVQVKNAIQNLPSKTKPITMTAAEGKKFFKNIEKDMLRLKNLIEKATARINPEIFSKIQTNSSGNIIPDIKNIPDTIPAEDLTQGEIKEIERILRNLDIKERIEIVNYDRKGDVYNDLISKSVSVDEYIAYMKAYKLDTANEPKTWRDIARSSYGKMKDTAAAKQYGVKAWMKELFYSSSANEKSDLYANLAEKWFERLIVLDLIDDKAFVRIPGKTGEDDKSIPSSLLKKLEDEGKYTRSKQLKDTSTMLELVNRYTTDPKYVKRYFDYDRSDNLDVKLSEKIKEIESYASSELEYDMLLKRLVEEDKDIAIYAIFDAMFEGNSGFRIFATGLLKEYYNKYVWPQIEISLAQAIKKYFDINYGKGIIASSLMPGQSADNVKKEEGKVLFNKIIYLVMERTGIKSSSDRMPKIGSSREQQREYFLGNTKDQRGNFANAVNKFKLDYNSKIEGISGTLFGPDDVNKLLDDMFSDSGIIGSEFSKRKKLTKANTAEIITWILSYPENKLDVAIILGMSLSDFYKRTGTDTMILQAVEGILSDTEKSLADYKAKFGSLLVKGTDFIDYLDEFGFDPLELKKKGKSKASISNFE